MEKATMTATTGIPIKEFASPDSIATDAARKLREIADRLDTLVIDEIKMASYALPRIGKILGELDLLVDGGALSQMARELDEADRLPF
jgi:hypothetical protein